MVKKKKKTRVLYVFWIQVPYQMYDPQIFSSSLWALFPPLLDDSFKVQKF